MEDVGNESDKLPALDTALAPEYREALRAANEVRNKKVATKAVGDDKQSKAATTR